MGFIALRCPHCGADIELDDKRESGFCSYCGTKILNDNIKTMRIDNSAQFVGALTGALNSLMANDLEVADELVDEALKQNGDCSDALFLKSATMLGKDYAKAASYHRLAKNNQSTVDIVSEEKYVELLVNHLDSLWKQSEKYVKATLARDDYSPRDMGNCMIYVTKNMFGRIADEFPYYDGIIKDRSERDFAEIERSISMPNEITQQHWDALRRFDGMLLRSTVLLFSNTSLSQRYRALIGSYGERLDNKWVGLFKKGPVDVDRRELAGMRGRANLFLKWLR